MPHHDPLDPNNSTPCTAAMAIGMLAFMLFHREQYAGGAHHHPVVPQSQAQPRRHIPWRRMLLVTAYVSAIPMASVADIPSEGRTGM